MTETTSNLFGGWRHEILTLGGYMEQSSKMDKKQLLQKKKNKWLAGNIDCVTISNDLMA